MTAAQLILIGAPAAGKSTVGRLVAERLQVPFTDTDELLALQLGLSLPEAWAALPEQRIMAAETAVCARVLTEPGVIALGSRAVAAPAIRAALADRNVVWLRVSAIQLTRRLGMATLGMQTLSAIRPQMDALLAERAPWYEEAATRWVDTDALSVAAVVDLIEQAWEGVV